MIKRLVKRALNAAGYDIVRTEAHLTQRERDVVRKVRPFTMTSAERVAGVVSGVEYLVANGIEGDFVECGVWRGGSTMAAAYTLLDLNQTSRELYLFDTYEGMTPPTEKDRDHFGESAQVLLEKNVRREGGGVWAYASYEDVARNMAATGYPADRIRMMRGRVEDTIPHSAPERIALLRLDTDWYESTKHTLENLYPRLAPNGLLIIDDYGHWVGAKQAVDEYFAKQRFKPFLNKLDYSGRLIVKIG